MIKIQLNSDTKALDLFMARASRLPKQVDIAVKSMAYIIQATAKTKISRGARHGRVYKRRTIRHIASAPGEYPKTDTGRLVNSIFVNHAEFLVAEVGSNVKYAQYLEENGVNKNGRMTGRPWLSRAQDDSLQKIERLLDSALKRIF